MIREILALGLSNDKEPIGIKTALCFSLGSRQKMKCIVIFQSATCDMYSYHRN